MSFEETYTEHCPLCLGEGYVTEPKVFFREKVFIRLDGSECCRLCEGEGTIEIVDNPIKSEPETTRDKEQSYFYRGGSPIL